MSQFFVVTRETEVAPAPAPQYGQAGISVWTDETGDPLQSQFSRLNPQLNADPRFWMMTQAGVTSGYAIQFACEIQGVVEPDANLGGELFLPVTVLERPLGLEPVSLQSPGLSAVHNIIFKAYGHYTLNFVRQNHGAKIVHFDVRSP